ncbi:serine hydrolase domain-containing protein [Polyangium sp. 15x6]|uniref:serine hydrolase domain-containing protein n=1 Tax=Polyangium sp. 15x6 TaxID=3042687 RepID=UPI00249C6A56|nr:serine hydrolase domain-containing protein [Polyangium sp. 15x6]MDI3285983.1 serine hydrolase domain-containing protein [Polyangium sp. 15x6]
MSQTRDLLLEIVSEIEAPGLVVAVCDRREILWHHTRGHADREARSSADLDTLFSACSITKTFTATAILMLRDAGLLALDEPLHESVPEASALRYPTTDCSPITLRHLLTHTSGLPRGIRDLRGVLRREPDERELLEHLSNVTLERAPHEERSYSNLGYALLGIAVARRSGKSYTSYVEEQIFAPLGITEATFDPENHSATHATPHDMRDGGFFPQALWKHGAYVPVGGLYASARALVHWVQYQLSAWPPRDDLDPARPLRRSTVRESHRIGGLQRAGRNGSGLGWAIERGGLGHVVHHSGGSPIGYSSFAGFEPNVGVGIVGLANADVGLEASLVRLLHAFAVSRGLVEDRRR